MRRILHIDMDAFFAAVEQQRRPELAGKPVVIGGRGDPSRRGVVSTANYEARKFRIHSGMPLRTAYNLCPRAVFLPVDYEAYSRISTMIKETLRGISPIMEDVGIDEAFLEIIDSDDSDEAVVRRIKERIREKTGLTCSIGIASNKLLAKIASDMQKPDGVTIMRESDIGSHLWPLAIRKLYGVGPKMEAALTAMGIETIGQLAATPLDTLVERFGNSYGGYLHDASRGLDDSALVTHWEPKSISRETTFQEDVKNWQTIARTLADLAREVTADLKGHRYRAKTVTIKIRFADFTTFTRAMTVSVCTDSEEEIRKAAFACLKRIELDRKVRLVGVRVSSLER
jgi:DNA polymerase IV